MHMFAWSSTQMSCWQMAKHSALLCNTLRVNISTLPLLLPSQVKTDRLAEKALSEGCPVLEIYRLHLKVKQCLDFSS